MNVPTWLLVMIASSLLTTDGKSLGRDGNMALLFRDHAVVLENVKDFAGTELTFEAWLSTSDRCHRSGIMSYAVHSTSTSKSQQVADSNEFVVFDVANVLACRGFKFIDLLPDPRRESCASQFNHSNTANFVENDGAWHHIAVTWTAASDGLTKIYKDGLKMAEAHTGQTQPLQANGALVLGGEQDCYGGCLDEGQQYFGMMDEVRVWRSERTQGQIQQWMRRTSSELSGHRDLVLAYTFDDEQPLDSSDRSGPRTQATDVSGKGNVLPLVNLPKEGPVDINPGGGSKHLKTTALTFKNNYAMLSHAIDMPQEDFTVAMWARTPAIRNDRPPSDDTAMLLSYATHAGIGDGNIEFVDQAILISKYNTEYRSTREVGYQDISTAGSISIHINSNKQGHNGGSENWADFDVHWLDSDWHHIAVSWEQRTGATVLWFDGRQYKPFRVCRAGVTTITGRNRSRDIKLATGTVRGSTGSLVLGQNQECYAGCFSAGSQFTGALSLLRMWDRVLPKSEVIREQWSLSASKRGLTLEYDFKTEESLVPNRGSTGAHNDLVLGADAPMWVTSTVPLALDTAHIDRPRPSDSDWSLKLHDKQVIMHPNFADFPEKAITVEFWMLSSDACNYGTPFSYATGEYSEADNSFLILNYRSFGVAVMEDEGNLADHYSGFGATDGTWHHIAVTWQSSDGRVHLYDNGRLVWSAVRGKGKRIPSGGTLILGREQDCVGGCFDSRAGAKGKLGSHKEYGAQDFIGLIDEVRIWDHAKSQSELKQGIEADAGRLPHGGAARDGAKPVDPKAQGLVAYWAFDEGEGYVVKDITGNGHDLQILADPQWVAVQGAFSKCGNGIVESGEECDDGSRSGGDGCSKYCQIEMGWVCTGSSPSKCEMEDSAARRASHSDRTSWDSHTASGSSSRENTGWLETTAFVLMTVAVVVVVVAVAAVVAAAQGVHASDALDKLRQVKSLIADKLASRRWTPSSTSAEGGYSGLGGTNDCSAAPHSFLAAAPAPHGHYESLPSNHV